MKDVVTLSDAAWERIGNILSNAEQGAAIRFAVAEGGCAGMKYKVTVEHEIGEADQIITNGTSTIIIGPESLFFLLGSQIDYQTSTFESGFTYSNPNVVDACGCGESIKFASQS